MPPMQSEFSLPHFKDPISGPDIEVPSISTRWQGCQHYAQAAFTPTSRL